MRAITTTSSISNFSKIAITYKMVMHPPQIMGLPIIQNKINGILHPITPQNQIISADFKWKMNTPTIKFKPFNQIRIKPQGLELELNSFIN